jgi:hypothetical protein
MEITWWWHVRWWCKHRGWPWRWRHPASLERQREATSQHPRKEACFTHGILPARPPAQPETPGKDPFRLGLAVVAVRVPDNAAVVYPIFTVPSKFYDTAAICEPIASL